MSVGHLHLLKLLSLPLLQETEVLFLIHQSGHQGHVVGLIGFRVKGSWCQSLLFLRGVI